MIKFNYLSNKGVIQVEKFSSIQEVFLKGIEMVSHKSEGIGRAKQKYTIEVLGML